MGRRGDDVHVPDDHEDTGRLRSTARFRACFHDVLSDLPMGVVPKRPCFRWLVQGYCDRLSSTADSPHGLIAEVLGDPAVLDAFVQQAFNLDLCLREASRALTEFAAEEQVKLCVVDHLGDNPLKVAEILLCFLHSNIC